jgi:hypothetical protein
MNQFDTFDACYRGCDETGRLILTDEFQSSIDAHYAREGRARATDAAPDDFEFDDSERLAQLQQHYDRALGKAERIPDRDRDAFLHPQLNNLPLEAERTRKAGETMSGIAPEEHQKRLDYFKKTHPNLTTDQEADDEVESLMELENYYASRRGQALLALIFVIAAFFVQPAQAQVGPQPTAIYGTGGGAGPIVGSPCQNIPPQPAPTTFLVPTGGLIVCVAGLWQSSPFAVFLPSANAATMTGSDVPIYSTTLPPLAPGACYSVAYGIGAGLSGATIKLNVDGATISTPFSAGTVGGVDVSVAGLRYCNSPGSQTAQTLVYELGAAGWLTFVTPNSGWDYSGGGGGIGDAPITSPTAVNWALPHTLTLTVNQPSGSVTPGYLRISGGY